MFKSLTTNLRWVLVALCFMFSTVSHAITSNDFCWLDSYGRGVGTIPTNCGQGKENDAGLCYNRCENGYDGAGPVCWQQCPAGYVDTGALCHIDKPLVVKGSWDCTKRFWGICIWHRTDCPAGYGNGFLDLCSLNPIQLPAGMHGTYLDPMKNTYGRGVGTIPNECPGGQYDAGLCYNNCTPGHKGVGPVCWGECPNGKSACGAGCADSSTTCAMVIGNQVMSVGSLMATIATSGLLAPAMKAATEAEQAAEAERATSALAQLKRQWAAIKDTTAYKAAYGANKLRQIEAVASANTTDEALRNAANLDPTGFVNTAAAFAFPRCDAGW